LHSQRLICNLQKGGRSIIPAYSTLTQNPIYSDFLNSQFNIKKRKIFMKKVFGFLLLGIKIPK